MFFTHSCFPSIQESGGRVWGRSAEREREKDFRSEFERRPRFFPRRYGRAPWWCCDGEREAVTFFFVLLESSKLNSFIFCCKYCFVIGKRAALCSPLLSRRPFIFGEVFESGRHARARAQSELKISKILLHGMELWTLKGTVQAETLAV